MMLLALAAPLGTTGATSLENFVTTAFQVAVDEINGDFGQFGLAIFGALLSWHILLGGAELALGDPNCRFLKAGFYVRFFTVCGALFALELFFVKFSQVVATKAASEMVDTLVKPWQVCEQVTTLMIKNMGDFVDANTGTWSIISAPITILGSTFIVIGVGVLCMACYYLAAILMAVQGYVGIAYAAIILILAPVLLPFALHESTEGIAWAYIKAWLIYGVLYLPICVIAMHMAETLMWTSFLSINAKGLTAAGVTANVVQLFSLIAAPLAVIGIVFIPNAALNKVL